MFLSHMYSVDTVRKMSNFFQVYDSNEQLVKYTYFLTSLHFCVVADCIFVLGYSLRPKYAPYISGCGFSITPMYRKLYLCCFIFMVHGYSWTQSSNTDEHLVSLFYAIRRFVSMITVGRQNILWRAVWATVMY